MSDKISITTEAETLLTSLEERVYSASAMGHWPLNDVLDTMDIYLTEPTIIYTEGSRAADEPGHFRDFLYHKLKDLSDYDDSTSQKTDFFAFMNNFMKFGIEYAKNTRCFDADQETNARIVNASEEILLRFPGLNGIRQNLLRHYIANGRGINSGAIRKHENELAVFLSPEDARLPVARMRFAPEQYAGINFDSFIELCWSDYTGSEADDLAHSVMFTSYFSATMLTNIRASLEESVVSISKHVSPELRELYCTTSQTAIRKLDDYRLRLLREFDDKADSLGFLEMLDYLVGQRNRYVDRMTMLDEIVHGLPGIIQSVDPEYANVIFSNVDDFPLKPPTVLTDKISRIKVNLDRIKDTCPGHYEEIFGIVGRYRNLDDVEMASAQLHPLAANWSGTTYSKLLSKDDLRAGEIGQAIEWHGKHKSIIDEGVASAYLNRCLQYGTELSIVFEYLFHDEQIREHGTISDVTLGINERFDYVFGKPDKRTPAEKLEKILRRNALKIKIGRRRYEVLKRDLLDINNLNRKGELDEEQYERIESFLQHFSHEKIPVHEWAVKTISKNPTYIMEVDLADRGRITTFVKLYDKDLPDSESGFEFERGILEGLVEAQNGTINAANCLSNSNIRGYFVNMLTFFNGESLYQCLNDGLDHDQRKEHFRSAIEQLAAIQAEVPQIAEQKGLDLNPILDSDSRYFFDDLRERLKKGGINDSTTQKIIDSYACVSDVLVGASMDDPVYFKDCNPRNILDEDGKITHVDFEYRDLLLGEMDIVKLFRYGLELETWNTDMDYTVNDAPEKREAARRYAVDNRYLSPNEEQNQKEFYFRTRGFDIDDDTVKIEHEKRYDFAALHVHLRYVGWYSQKSGEVVTEKDTRINANRARYHLLEAKLKLDKIMGIEEYAVDNKQLYNLRCALDEISI